MDLPSDVITEVILDYVDFDGYEENATKSEFTKRSLNEYKSKTRYKCCFYKGICGDEDGDKETFKFCLIITKDNYYNINKLVKEAKDNWCKVSVDC